MTVFSLPRREPLAVLDDLRDHDENRVDASETLAGASSVTGVLKARMAMTSRLSSGQPVKKEYKPSTQKYV